MKEIPSAERITEILEAYESTVPEYRDPADVAIGELLAALDEAEHKIANLQQVAISESDNAEELSKRLAETEESRRIANGRLAVVVRERDVAVKMISDHLL